jgi:two-component system response regulator FixJ
MACNTIVIVSAYPEVRHRLSELVASAGLGARTVSSLENWLEATEPETDGCLVLDAGVGELLEPGRLASFASVCARIPVVVLIDRGDVPTAVRAIKHGAAEVLQKPFRDGNLLACLTRMVREKGAMGATC